MPVFPIPARRAHFWLKPRTQELMRNSLVPHATAQPGDPTSFYCCVSMGNDIRIDPVSMCMLVPFEGRSIPGVASDILEIQGEHRGNLALGAIALQSDPGFVRALRTAGEMRTTSRGAWADVLCTADAMIVFSGDPINVMRDKAEKDLETGEELQDVAMMLLSTPPSAHQTIDQAQRIAGFPEAASEAMEFFVPETHEKIRFAAPDYARLAEA